MSRFLIGIAAALSAMAPSGPLAAKSFPPFLINFGPGAARPDAAAPQVIAKALASYRDGDGEAALTVSGHTDRVGSIDANRRLSCARAKAVRARLISQGIPADRIFVAGFGETRPYVETADNTSHPANRRVEIAVVPFSWPASSSDSASCR